MKLINTTLNLQKLYKSEKGADVVFVLESKESNGESKVPAHKAVLAAASPVFDSMFFGDLQEGAVVNIVDASFEAFCEFLQFFYMDKIQLTRANIFEVIKLLDKYNVQQHIPFCERFLLETVTTDLVCLYYELAITYNFSEELIARFEGTITNETSDVLNTSSFKKCGRIALQNMLELDTLECSEAILFKAVMSWAVEACQRKGVSPSSGKLKAELGNCLSLIRFPVMTPDEFASCMELYPNLLSHNVLYDIWNYILNGRPLTSAMGFKQNSREISTVNVSFWKPNVIILLRREFHKSFISLIANNNVYLNMCYIVIPTAGIASRPMLCKVHSNGVLIQDFVQTANVFPSPHPNVGLFRFQLSQPLLCAKGKLYDLCFELNIDVCQRVQLTNYNSVAIKGIQFDCNENLFIGALHFIK